MITALSIKKENCIAIISNKNENNSTLIKRLKSFNIKNILILENYYPSEIKFSNYKNISSQEDLLKFKFKFNFSNDIVYDELCKLQRNSFVDIKDRDLHKTLKNFEEIILSAENLLRF